MERAPVCPTRPTDRRARLRSIDAQLAALVRALPEPDPRRPDSRARLARELTDWLEKFGQPFALVRAHHPHGRDVRDALDDIRLIARVCQDQFYACWEPLEDARDVLIRAFVTGGDAE